MAISRLTDAERETHVSYSAADDTMVITTAINKDILQLQKKGYKLRSVNREVYTFEAPKKFLSFRTIEATEVKPKRTLSAEHKRKLRESRDGRKESTEDH